MVNIETHIDLFESKLKEMAFLSLKSMEKATNLIQSFDKEVAQELIDEDIKMNKIEIEINNIAIEILSLLQPVAKDLRIILGGIKIANDLERISDYAKNIGRYVLKKQGIQQEHAHEILKLQNVFMDNFKDVIALIEKPNLKAAFTAAHKDEILDVAFTRFSNDIIVTMKDDMQFPFLLFNISRTIERAGDHTKNICEQVIYILSGDIIDFG